MSLPDPRPGDAGSSPVRRRPMRMVTLGGHYVTNAVKLPVMARAMRPRRRS